MAGVAGAAAVQPRGAQPGPAGTVDVPGMNGDEHHLPRLHAALCGRIRVRRRRGFPRTGVPDYFGSWSEYENYVNLLVGLHCIDDAKKIWWDIRPHPTFGTLEFRVCDVPTRAEETVAIAAVIQAIVVKLYKLYTQNMGFRLYRRALIEENKWRAARWGVDGRLIDFGKKAEVPMRDLALEPSSTTWCTRRGRRRWRSDEVLVRLGEVG